jgi:MoaA/NifB/PqqE/SkfB family radical SAM enzyme
MRDTFAGNSGDCMEPLESSGTPSATPITRIIWDLTYACPLRCKHCYSESGRRPARMLDRERMRRVAQVIVAARPERVSFSGGEPLAVPWWGEAADLLGQAGIPVTVFTSGWAMSERMAERLAGSVAAVTVSVDGRDEQAHDAIRGRAGSFRRAMAALDRLSRVKRSRAERGEKHFRLGIDYTVTRSGHDGLGDFVAEATSRFPNLDYVRFGAVMPVGLGQEAGFVAEELLGDAELEALVGAESELISRARHGIEVSVTDVRSFLPTSPLSVEGDGIAQIEPDGQLRAFACYEAKVGNVLDEPIDVLWDRALAWRNTSFVREQTGSIRTLTDWARVTRVLDRRYGSVADKARIALRT